MSGYLADVGALARKDLRLELRARDTLPAMLLFVLSTHLVELFHRVHNRPALPIFHGRSATTAVG